MRKLLAILILAFPLAGIAQTVSEQAHAVFERDWQWRLRAQPELATTVGEHGYDNALSDTSPFASRDAIEHERHMLEAIRAIDRNELAGQDRLSYDLFVEEKERRLAAAAFHPYEPHPITAQQGLHVRLPQLVAQMPFATAGDYRNYIGRLASLPRHLDGLIEQMREGMRTGWTAPKTVVRPVPGMLQEMRANLADGTLGAPFRAIPSTIEPEVREELARAGQEALISSAAPALERLESFIRNEYLPAARETIAASSLPGGPEWYALLVRNSTTTSLAPAAVHALGLNEVARIRGEVDAAIARTGFRGSFAQFAAFARSDPRLFPASAHALAERYRRTLERARARLPSLLEQVPAEEIVVRTVDASGQVAAYYEAGMPGRPAALVVNISRLDTRPLWQIEALALHEGLPGHHAQVARAHEIEGLPAFRRFGWQVAFGEGWALYAESLGPQAGFYRDAFSAFGQLNEELLRAARLVVDTGIHAMGWSRQQALDYLNANTANPAADNEVEVDRYIAQPAQALGYKVGQLRILALRDKARAALGARFDLRRFHNAVLDNGPLPLDILAREIDRWIAKELAQGQEQGRQAVPAPKNKLDQG